MSIVGARIRIENLKRMAPAVRIEALLDLAKQAAEQGDLTAAAIFALASEVSSIEVELSAIHNELWYIRAILKDIGSDISSALSNISYILERSE